MQGHHDPFCRLPYPWGKEDAGLLCHFTHLGRLRATHGVFADGDFSILAHTDAALLYQRANEAEQLLVAVNGGDTSAAFTLPEGCTYRPIPFPDDRGSCAPLSGLMTLPPHSAILLCKEI
jgi:hypothetical protein